VTRSRTRNQWSLQSNEAMRSDRLAEKNQMGGGIQDGLQPVLQLARDTSIVDNNGWPAVKGMCPFWQPSFIYFSIYCSLYSLLWINKHTHMLSLTAQMMYMLLLVHLSDLFKIIELK